MKSFRRRSPAYRPIEDYGVIGNLATSALVRRDGSIDWCCFPFMESRSVFGALLDAERGGYFQIAPSGDAWECEQHYLEGTNVLVTSFRTARGAAEVWDFMPTEGDLSLDERELDRREICRQVRCTEGEMELELVWAPRMRYGAERPVIREAGEGVVARVGDELLSLGGVRSPEEIEREGPAVGERFRLEKGERRYFCSRWGEHRPVLREGREEEKCRETIQAWLSWLEHRERGHRREWAKPFEGLVRRSELTLKLMCVQESGAVAAAMTTSLPETIGGTRNWDYRFSWIRDAAQIAQVFFGLDHSREAESFISWAEGRAKEEIEAGRDVVGILYPLRPGGGVEEVEFSHLEGYRGSAPVRVGNGAADQLQLDVYGELLNVIYEQVRLGGNFNGGMKEVIDEVLERVIKEWSWPDYSIWEVKNGPNHHVYSKVMSWVALNRACWLAEKGHLEGDRARWRREKTRIREEVLRHGYNQERGAFTMWYQDKELDAANLLIPLMEFLPAEDERVQSTIDRTMEDLMVNDLVYRYRRNDGLPGEEGAFVLTTCWLVDALAISGRVEEAERIFESLMGRANHLGLFSEEIDPYSGAFLGNFPQAYSHVGLINSSLHLARSQGREIPVHPLLGCD